MQKKLFFKFSSSDLAQIQFPGFCQTKKTCFFRKRHLSRKIVDKIKKIMMLSNRRKCIKMRIFWIYQHGRLVVKSGMPFFVVPRQKARKGPEPPLVFSKD